MGQIKLRRRCVSKQKEDAQTGHTYAISQDRRQAQRAKMCRWYEEISPAARAQLASSNCPEEQMDDRTECSTGPGQPRMREMQPKFESADNDPSHWDFAEMKRGLTSIESDSQTHTQLQHAFRFAGIAQCVQSGA